MKGSQGEGSNRHQEAGTTTEIMKEYCHWFSLLCMFSYLPYPDLPKDSTAHSRLGPPTPVGKQENAPTDMPIDQHDEQFLRWGSLFLGVSSWQPRSTITVLEVGPLKSHEDRGLISGISALIKWILKNSVFFKVMRIQLEVDNLQPQRLWPELNFSGTPTLDLQPPWLLGISFVVYRACDLAW